MLETTITVVFNNGSGDEEYLILAELDDVLNVDSEGETISTFSPGDEPYIRFNSSTNVRIDEVVATSGGVLSLGTESRAIELEQLFASKDPEEPSEINFSVAPNYVGFSYIGRAGRLTSESLTYGRVKYVSDIAYTPFLAAVDIHYTAKIYQLIPPPLSLSEGETYNIHVVFYVTLVG